MHHLLHSLQWLLRKTNEQVPISQWMLYLPWALVSEALHVWHSELASHTGNLPQKDLSPKEAGSSGLFKILSTNGGPSYLLFCSLVPHPLPQYPSLSWSLPLQLLVQIALFLKTLVTKISLQLTGNFKGTASKQPYFHYFAGNQIVSLWLVRMECRLWDAPNIICLSLLTYTCWSEIFLQHVHIISVSETLCA